MKLRSIVKHVKQYAGSSSSSGTSAVYASTSTEAQMSDSVSDSENEGQPESSEKLRTVSILDRLQEPSKSDLTRKRKIHSNPPSGKRRSSGSYGLKEPKVN